MCEREREGERRVLKKERKKEEKKKVIDSVHKSLGEYTVSALEHCKTADKPIRTDLVG